MSAAAERAALARIGENLVALVGDRGVRRAASDSRSVFPAATFADIARAPDWLQLPRDRLVALSVRVALFAMAPALAHSIDGGWLRALAERAGEDALDHAIARADAVPDHGVAPVAVDTTEALGFDLLRATLAPALHRYLEWAPGGDAARPAALAVFAVGEALAETQA